MVYRKGDGHTYYTRVTASGQRVVCSTGTTSKTTAASVEAWVKGVQGRHDPLRVLDAVVARTITLVDAFRLGEVGARAQLDAMAAHAADSDLRPYLAQWLAWRRQRKTGHAVLPHYEAQILRLWPEPRWPKSQWTPMECVRRLDALTKVSDGTRNRYRAALSAFAKYLVRTGVLDSNPVRDIGGYAESETQVLWYTEADAKRIIAALPAEYRVREALMVGTGMDWSDCARVRRRDVDLTARTVRCHGSKTPHRNRVVRITEAWVLKHLEPLKTMLPDALVCPPTATKDANKDANRVHRAALTACKIAQDSTLHDWRHHYAVTAFRRGEKPQVVTHQLGHGTTKLALDLYGKYLPNASDYLPESEADSATDLAPSTVKAS